MLSREKRGQGLSINVIIVATLLLAVLFVVVMIFTGKIELFGSRLASCDAKAGVCKAECEKGELLVEQTDCGDKVCCVRVIDSG